MHSDDMLYAEGMLVASTRDDFTPATVRRLAQRAGYMCAQLGDFGAVRSTPIFGGLHHEYSLAPAQPN